MEFNIAKLLRDAQPKNGVSSTTQNSNVLIIAGEIYLLVDVYENIKSTSSLAKLVQNVNFGFVNYASLNFTYLDEKGKMESFAYQHVEGVSGLIFVIDGNNTDSIIVAATALMKLYLFPALRKLPLVVFALKTGSEREMNQDEIRTWLNLNYKVAEIRLLYDESTTHNEIHSGLYWLLQRLKS